MSDLRYIGESNTIFTHNRLYDAVPEGMGMYSVVFDDGVGYDMVDSDLIGTDGYPWEYSDG